MGKRPARCYRRVAGPAYTRTARRVVRKAFIRGVPNPVLTHMDMGNSGLKYKYQVLLVSDDWVQVRHNALEACRIVVNKVLSKEVGVDNFHFQVRAYPHHVLRENAIITGAGADRLQTGMRHAFGRPKSRAARIKPGQAVFSVKVNTKKAVETARAAFKKIKPKLPMATSIELVELN
ncbi:MAG: 50S ribosomal protein L16 [Candidatus Diapherotrites archaeon]|nr:50S ribosomal protein L16 [Candidatus Diapherotrites archaeon]